MMVEVLEGLEDQSRPSRPRQNQPHLSKTEQTMSKRQGRSCRLFRWCHRSERRESLTNEVCKHIMDAAAVKYYQEITRGWYKVGYERNIP